MTSLKIFFLHQEVLVLLKTNQVYLRVGYY